MSTGEPRAERNKRIAIEAITLLERAVNGEISEGVLDVEFEAFRGRWEARGVHWMRRAPRDGFNLDMWVTADEMAAHADVRPGTVRSWHYRGYITSTKRNGRPLYNVGEVVRYHTQRKTVG